LNLGPFTRRYSLFPINTCYFSHYDRDMIETSLSVPLFGVDR